MIIASSQRKTTTSKSDERTKEMSLNFLDFIAWLLYFHLNRYTPPKIQNKKMQ
jgi:hypothetical protein